MKKFNDAKTPLNFQSRLVFLMVTEDLFKMYVNRYNKRQKIKKITAGFKLTATIALLSLCLFLVYSLHRFSKLMEQRFTKIKAAKEKRKQKKRKRRVLSEL